MRMTLVSQALGLAAFLCSLAPATAFHGSSGLPSLRPRGALSSGTAIAQGRAGRIGASGLKMGGGNVPRVPYKAPGEQSYQFIDIWNRMYRERILYVGQDLDDEFANQMVATMLYLNNEDATAGIQMYFNCPGGEIRAGLAVYDTMNNMGYEISTLNLGIAASISGFLCGAGTAGKRMCLPNARFLLQTPKLEDMGLSQVLYGQASDVKIEAEEIMRQREKVYRGLEKHTGRPYEKIRDDLTRDLYLTAPEAIDYGLIDKVLLPLQKDDKDYQKMAADGGKNFGKI